MTGPRARKSEERDNARTAFSRPTGGHESARTEVARGCASAASSARTCDSSKSVTVEDDPKPRRVNSSAASAFHSLLHLLLVGFGPTAATSASCAASRRNALMRAGVAPSSIMRCAAVMDAAELRCLLVM